MAAHYERLLEHIAANPNSRVSRIPILTDAERRRVLVDWNDTGVQYDRSLTLHKAFESRAGECGERIAVEFDGERLTYGELNAQANQLARCLQALGVGPGSIVGVHLERSIEMVLALYAVLKAGAAYAPLDPEYPSARLANMLEDARPKLIITHSRLKGGLPSGGYQTLELDSERARLHSFGQHNLDAPVTAEDLAYVIFTSGSTGRPKGVMNTHKGICNRLLWMQDQYRLGHEDTVLQKTPYSFDVSVWEFFWPLLVGAKLVVAAPGAHRDSRALCGLIRSHTITVAHFVPSMLNAFLRAPDVDESCASLRHVFCSGEALSSQLQQEFHSRIGARLHNLYGPTEAAVDVTHWTCSPADRGAVPIGRPVANTRLYILDQHLEPVPIGVPGELHIGGVQVARGYINRPDLTAQRFVPDPFGTEPGATLYKTGDLARYRNDGAIEYLGRLDHQIKLRGFRIELGEIEECLRQQPLVSDAVVVTKPDATGGAQIVAYVLARQDGKPSVVSLRNHLQQTLPEYMVPAAYVVMAEFPLNANGKVDRKALPAPTREHRSEEDFVAPQSDVERQIAAIWAHVLGVEKVGLHDNFFEQGGHSLSLVRVESEIRSRLGKTVPLVEFFRRPTVKALARFVTEEEEQPQDLDRVRDRVARQKAALRAPKKPNRTR
jgi:amino acid adenylation domain-containing protein